MRRPVRNLLRFCAASLAVLAADMAVFIATRPAPPPPTLRLGFAETVARGLEVFGLFAGLSLAGAAVLGGAVFLSVQAVHLARRRRNRRKAEWFLAPAAAILALCVAFFILITVSVDANVRGVRRIEETCRLERPQTTDDLVRLFGEPDAKADVRDGELWFYYVPRWPRILFTEPFRFQVFPDGRVAVLGVRKS
jgi:hypothetical protein